MYDIRGNIVEIPARLINRKLQYVAGASDIKDDKKGISQQVLNKSILEEKSANTTNTDYLRLSGNVYLW